MAGGQKRKRLEKDPGPALPPSTQKFYCCRCGKAFSRQKGYFPVSHSPAYRGTGFLPMCSDCVDGMFDFYCELYDDQRKAMRRMCMILDLYWSDALYDMVERQAGVNSRVRSYIGKSNIVRYIDKTFDDTIAEEEEAAATAAVRRPRSDLDEEAEVVEPEVIEISDDVILFWGPGYTPEMYLELEGRRAYWTSRFPDNYSFDIGEEALIRQICNIEIDINHDRAAGKSIDKNVNTLNALLGSLNLKPTQQKKEEVDSELERIPLGVGIQKWENSRPLPETPKSLSDVSGAIKNITTWYLGHACKMVGLKNSYTKLYEDAMNDLRVKAPEYDEEDDDTLLSDIFGGPKKNGGD